MRKSEYYWPGKVDGRLAEGVGRASDLVANLM